MTTAEQLGSQIKAARDAAALTLRELAQQVEISASTIGEYERGVKVPEADKLAKIAAALSHFTFRIDDYTFTISTKGLSGKELAVDRQLPLDFTGEYTYTKAHIKIEPGKISVAFDGVTARSPRATMSRN
jgi:transcriptional regulator with XRE-family HTH domain